MLTATLTSPDATGTFAALLATALVPPALVTLRGDLGTGKTTLVREVLHALGVEGVVASPSFTLAQSYEGAGGLRLHHLDLYRLSPGADAGLFAFDDYLDGAALTFVEWPEAAAAELPAADVDVLLSHRTLESRGLALRAPAGFEAALAAALRAAGGFGEVTVAPGAGTGEAPA
jgi:tRNA threonylcarbamoyladenosine biosynthesis protein TsaE